MKYRGYLLSAAHDLNPTGSFLPHGSFGNQIRVVFLHYSASFCCGGIKGVIQTDLILKVFLKK